jgi:hypothetical protein
MKQIGRFYTLVIIGTLMITSFLGGQAAAYEVIITQKEDMECLLFTFKGVTDRQPIPYIPEAGMTFSEDWIAFKIGSYTGNPSWPEAARLRRHLGGKNTSASVLFDNPVGCVSFYYASSKDVTMEAFDSEYNLIATTTGPFNADGAVGFHKWDPICIVMNQNLIHSIVITASTGLIYIDDFKMCTLFPEVSIDIKPGSFPNSINLDAKGNIPVAIFSTYDFDASTIDPTTITLAGAPIRMKGKNKGPHASFEDVNGDGLLDLVVHFVRDDLDLDRDSAEAILEGITFDGERFIGRDSVNIVPH